MKSDVFAIGLRLENKRCLVVGSGEEAERRARAFLDSGAEVRVVSERPTPELLRLAEAGELSLFRRGFEEKDFAGVWLAVSTDLDAAHAAEIAAVAEASGVFFCAVDQPAHSSYSHLALVKAGKVTVGISTNGRAPALARKLQEELRRVFDDAALADFADAIASLRERASPAERRALLAEAVSRVRFEGRLHLQGGPSDAK
jgi:precorrin-2 dehydrogenase/sirohydrochlorin ferrochelatase